MLFEGCFINSNIATLFFSVILNAASSSRTNGGEESITLSHAHFLCIVIHPHSLRNIRTFETIQEHINTTIGNRQKQADRTFACEYGESTSRSEIQVISNSYVFEKVCSNIRLSSDGTVYTMSVN